MPGTHIDYNRQRWTVTSIRQRVRVRVRGAGVYIRDEQTWVSFFCDSSLWCREDSDM